MKWFENEDINQFCFKCINYYGTSEERNCCELKLEMKEGCPKFQNAFCLECNHYQTPYYAIWYYEKPKECELGAMNQEFKPLLRELCKFEKREENK